MILKKQAILTIFCRCYGSKRLTNLSSVIDTIAVTLNSASFESGGR